MGGFFSSMALMEGKGVSGVIDNLNTVCLHSHSSIRPCIDFTIEVCTDSSTGMVRNVYLSIFSTTSTTRHTYRAVFTPAQMINFALVPPQFRFVFLSTVSLFWSMYSMFRFFGTAVLTPRLDRYLFECRPSTAGRRYCGTCRSLMAHTICHCIR